MPKNMASKGCARQENIGCKRGGGHQKILSCSDGALHQTSSLLLQSNVGVFFSRVEFYKGLYLRSHKKSNLSFSVFSFFVLFCLFVFLGGLSSQLFWEKRRGTLKSFS